ncbi:DMT family transporter [Antarcticimicrobium sediminis]|uniref:DMT family transporter n=1 Tax=Antarcticimicrobium sediminis TaxID=2546227 RepID=A0A4R5EUC0_9RHOB|nr:DMT family transporter [Antarcticimicrobium sediminis]TDE38382.1 DMT family transporter [Antarcticimicrobium sediminis]
MQEPSQPRVGLAALWMTGAITSFSAMAVAGREVSFALDTFEIMMYRSALGFAIVVVLLGLTGKTGQVNTRDLGQQTLRNLVHFAGQNLWFFAVTAIPLAQVFALEFTAPLWVVVLSPLVLGERLTPARAVSALVGFVGILIIARPSPDTLNVGVFAAAGAAVFFAFTNMLTKKLTRRHSVANIMFWLTLLQLIFGAITAGIDGDVALPDATTAPWLVVIALGGLLAHFCLANALSIAPATVVMPFDFARLPTIAIVGMILYAEPLEIWVFAGAAVIFAGNYLNILSETRRFRTA